MDSLTMLAYAFDPAGNLVERLKGADPNSAYTDYVSDTAVYDTYGQLLGLSRHRAGSSFSSCVLNPEANSWRTCLHYALDVLVFISRLSRTGRSSEPGAHAPSRAWLRASGPPASSPAASASVFSSTPRNASPPAPPRKREEEQA